MTPVAASTASAATAVTAYRRHGRRGAGSTVTRETLSGRHDSPGDRSEPDGGTGRTRRGRGDRHGVAVGEEPLVPGEFDQRAGLVAFGAGDGAGREQVSRAHRGAVGGEVGE